MKFIIILLLAQEPIYVPFDEKWDCYDQGIEVMESIATYQASGPKQGWYMDHGTLVYGFYCE